MAADPVVTTTAGRIRGIVDPTIGMRTWRGVPFGAPTGGQHRFRAPRPREPWTGELDTTRFAHPAMQGTYGWNDKVKGTEDCLKLDIVRPDTDDVLPVVVYMHGGTFLTGSSHEKVLQGHRFAKATDIVYVSINFRLGVLGYLDLRSLGGDCAANPATLDQILALEWVRDNIAAFGGDPDRVTIMGESAGASAVTALMCAPQARGLFHGAVAQSAPVAAVHTRLQAAMWTRALLDGMGMSRLSTIEDLRAVPGEELVRVGNSLLIRSGEIQYLNLAFMPTVDDVVLPRHPIDTFTANEEAPVPLLIGSNSGEASFTKAMFMFSRSREKAARRLLEVFDPTHADAILEAYNGATDRSDFAELVADAVFWAPSVRIATEHRYVAPVWMYHFDYAAPTLQKLGFGAIHTADLEAIFGAQFTTPAGILHRLGPRDDFVNVSEMMQYHWGSFFHTGRPGDAWPEYGFRTEAAPGRATAVIRANSKVVQDPKPEKRRAWEGFEMTNWGTGRPEIAESMADFLGIDPSAPNGGAAIDPAAF